MKRHLEGGVSKCGRPRCARARRSADGSIYASATNEFHLMTDVVSGVFSVICTALFLRFVWHPKTRFR